MSDLLQRLLDFAHTVEAVAEADPEDDFAGEHLELARTLRDAEAEIRRLRGSTLQ